MDKQSQDLLVHMMTRVGADTAAVALLVHILSDSGVLDKDQYLKGLHAMVENYQSRQGDEAGVGARAIEGLIRMIESDGPPEPPRFKIIEGGKADTKETDP